MKIEPLRHLQYQLSNATIKKWPFPHFFIEDAFPNDFYKHFRSTLPHNTSYKQGAGNYNGRVFADPVSDGTLSFFHHPDFLRSVVNAFEPGFHARFPTGHFTPKIDLRLVLDSQNYAIGPHTDARWKIVSLLFYLPEDYALERLGTAVYVPKDPDFRCEGGPHHRFDDFEPVYRAPFRPNSCFGFFKTDNSFHGVPPITIPCRRDVLLWNLYQADMMPH